MRKIISLLVLSIILLGINYSCQTSKKKDNVLKIGMELAYPPFEMSDTLGVPTGISVDFAHEIGKALNKKIEIVNIAYDGLIPSLKTGKIDMIISSMGITTEREKSVAFSIPYSKSFLTILANQKSNVTNVSDLNREKIRIAVKKGTTGHIYASKNLPKAELLLFDKENTCVLEVVQGKADAFLYDQMTVYRNWKKHPEQTKALLQPFQNDFEYWGIAFRHRDSALKQKVDLFIGEFQKSGGFEKLSEKYLADIRETFREQNIPFFFQSQN
ncbi:MAG: transporter substrate-binding domain-containing protein [Marinifilaceae bacterium]